MKLRSASLISAGCALLAVVLQARVRDAALAPTPEVSRTPAQYQRGEDFTFLTFPEWYLVYSPDEYADFIAAQPPSEFPFLGHLDQFWHGYRVVCQAAEKYPFNTDYHVMIWVIGVSTTVEYGLKWAYETLVGRVAERTCRSGMTAEDRLAARVAREYVDFLDVEPWYKFDFQTPLRRLWAETDWWGPDPIRKWERKYYLTSEFAAKALYGWVIKKASESAYEEEKPVTAVLLDRLPAQTQKDLADLKVVQVEADGAVLALAPRYQAFTTHARTLSEAGVNFREIAGNGGVILVSAIVPADYDDSGLKLLMRQPILTRSGLQRIVFVAAVGELGSMIRRRDKGSFRLEHLYDY